MNARTYAAIASAILFCFSPAVQAVGYEPTTGFHPLWENTGFIEEKGRVFLGTTGAHLGIANVAQVGFLPLSYMYRAPNAHVKVTAYRGEMISAAVQAGAMVLLAGSSRSLFSPMYAVRLDNPDFNVLVVPISLSVTMRPAEWIHLHHTLTGVLTSSDGPIQTRSHLGYSLVTELRGDENHSILLHLAEVGVWKHDFWLAGASYRFRNSWLELRGGYFYRVTDTGTPGGPLLGVGFAL